MPCYLYSNPKNPKEVVEVFQGMNDVHEYERDGVKWNRVFTVPQASVDAAIDPFDKNKFIEKTAKMKGNMGSLWEESAELSAKRADKRDGVDPIKADYYKKEREKRDGKPCHAEVKERSENIVI